MADLDSNQAAQAVRIIGSDLVGVETTPVASTSQGGLHSNLRDSAGNEILGTKNSNLSLPVSSSEDVTFGVGIIGLNVSNLATDIFTISGSNSRTIRIKKITVSGTQTTTSSREIVLLKRSTLNSGGTSTLLTGVPFDSQNPASLAVVRAYTANPTLGSLIGIISSIYGTFSVQAPTNAQGAKATKDVVFEFGKNKSQHLVLRNQNETVSINLNGVTFTGEALSISIEWSEE